MKHALFASLVALSFAGAMSTAPASAAPAVPGVSVKDTAQAGSSVQQVESRWWWRHHRHHRRIWLWHR